MADIGGNFLALCLSSKADFVKDGGAILKHGTPYVGFLALRHGPPSTTLTTRYIVLHRVKVHLNLTGEVEHPSTT